MNVCQNCRRYAYQLNAGGCEYCNLNNQQQRQPTQLELGQNSDASIHIKLARIEKKLDQLLTELNKHREGAE